MVPSTDVTIREFRENPPGQVSKICVVDFKIRVGTLQISGAELQILVVPFLLLG